MPERVKALFSSTGRGAFSFWQRQKENGGRTPVGTASWREPDPRGRLPAA